ncbi:MAG: FkbM family methyltransferase [Verrucomicrobiales bacterium]|jgi:FkbM family methyltransferase
MSCKLDERYLETIELPPGAIVVDCGASVGDTVAVFLAKGATVHAFEPNPLAFAHLKQRFEGETALTLYPNAISGADGTAEFYPHEDLAEDTLGSANGSSLLAFKGNVRTDEPYSVETVDLSRILRELGQQVAFLKIDIEGAEIGAVNRLLDTGAHRLADQIVVETHEIKIPELLEPTEKLRARIADEGVENIRLDWH